ncbi:MAG: amidohydrolase family protein [Anaerolineae bacterium]
MGCEGLGFYLRARRMCIRELEFLVPQLSGSEWRRVTGLIDELHCQLARREDDFDTARIGLDGADTDLQLKQLEKDILALEEWDKTTASTVQQEIDKAKVVALENRGSRAKPCPVIDVHVHNPSKEYLARVRADHCWWLNGRIEQAGDYPWTLACFTAPLGGGPEESVKGSPELTESSIRDMYDQGYRGYGEFKTSSSAPYEWQPYWKTSFDEERFQAIYRTCGELGMPVLFHMEVPAPDGYAGFILGDLDAYERMLERYPETIFIAHSHGWWRHIDADEANLPRLPTTPIKGKGTAEGILTKYPNAYCDLSGCSGSISLQRDLRFAKGFLTRNYAKVLFGTDYLWSPRALGLNYLEALQVLGLAPEVFEAIVWQNALRIVPTAPKKMHSVCGTSDP